MTEELLVVLVDGHFNGEAIRIRLTDGAPPPWLHMPEPLPSAAPYRPGPAVWEDHPVHTYERQPITNSAGDVCGWYYRHWTPVDTPKPPE